MGGWDGVFVLLLAGIVLLVLDWRIGKAFKGHEIREKQMYAEIALTADAAAGRARELAKQVDIFRAEHVLLTAAVENINEQLRLHDTRIIAVEKRLLLASLQVPHAHRRKDDADG